MSVLRFLFAVAALALAANCASDEIAGNTGSTWATLTGEAPLIIAHRGASGYLPEHTLEAYSLAIDQGADVIEPDLVFTKDGVLVARHDRYLSTTTNVADLTHFADRRRINPDTNDDPKADWWVEDFTLAELKTLRARQPFEGRSKEHDDQYGIPTFGEILALVERKSKEAGRPIGIYPETKHPAYFASIGYDFERPLLIALQGFRDGPVFIQSFEPETLKRLNGKTTAKLVQLVYEEMPGAGPNIPLADIAQYADGVGPYKHIILSQELCLSGFLLQAHELGLFVHPWTFRDDASVEYGGTGWGHGCTDISFYGIEPELSEFFYQGVDGVFTDFPDTAVKMRETTGGY